MNEKDNGFLDSEGLTKTLELLKSYLGDNFAALKDGIKRINLSNGSVYMDEYPSGIYMFGYKNSISTIYRTRSLATTNNANRISGAAIDGGFIIWQNGDKFSQETGLGVGQVKCAYIAVFTYQQFYSNMVAGHVRDNSQYGRTVIPLRDYGYGSDDRSVAFTNQVIVKGTTTEYTPTNPTDPANKGYVDTAIADAAINPDDLSEEILEQVRTLMSSAFKYKGTVAEYVDLPEDANVGDTYNIVNASEYNNAGDNAVWDGEQWDVLSGIIDLSDYQKKTDNRLNTTNKDVVDAINEVFSEAQSGAVKAMTLGGTLNVLTLKPGIYHITATANSTIKVGSKHMFDFSSGQSVGVIYLGHDVIGLYGAYGGNGAPIVYVKSADSTSSNDFKFDATTYITKDTATTLINNAIASHVNSTANSYEPFYKRVKLTEPAGLDADGGLVSTDSNHVYAYYTENPQANKGMFYIEGWAETFNDKKSAPRYMYLYVSGDIVEKYIGEEITVYADFYPSMAAVSPATEPSEINVLERIDGYTQMQKVVINADGLWLKFSMPYNGGIISIRSDKLM